MTSKTVVDPRDAAIAANPKDPRHAALPRELIEDLKYFAKRANAGSPIGFAGLQAYVQRTYQIRVGRLRMHSTSLANGIAPWWSK